MPSISFHKKRTVKRVSNATAREREGHRNSEEGDSRTNRRAGEGQETQVTKHKQKRVAQPEREQRSRAYE
jgi:hypothetical protein